jgi:acetolactate synthase-1/2/3 large subunit
MAEGFGQLTGRPAACMVTRAVGAANLAIALHTARQDSTPLIAIAGQVPRAFRGREAFQEADLVETFGRLCKEAAEVDSAARLAATANALIDTACSGRPGPVLLSVPEDVFDEEVDGDTGPARSRPHRRPHALSEASVDKALELVAMSRRPIIVAGAGVSRSAQAREALVAFAEAMAVPVIASWRRPDVFPNDHPLYLGMAGLSAPATVRRRLGEADVLLALGTRLSETTTFDYSAPADSTRLVQVDLEPGFPGDRRQPDVALQSDVAQFLNAAMARLKEPSASSLAQRRSHAETDRAAFLVATAPPDAATIAAARDGVHPASVVVALRELLPSGVVMTTDAGNFAGWIARYVPLPHDGRFLGPTSGAMGYALPAAIGAALAEPDRAVIAIAGDGGFAMLMAELETAVRERARIVVLVFDNRMYGTIRMHQEQAHPGRVVGTTLGPIDFASVANAMGARGVYVTSSEDARPAIAEALESRGVSVVHLAVDPRYLSVDSVLPG